MDNQPDPAQRLEICRKCPQHWARGGQELCKKCGCVVAWKAQLKDGKCPEGRW